MPAAATILIVDDQEDVRAVLEITLRRAGYTVALAADAPSAESVLGQTSAQLAIVDLNLGEESGLELARSLPVPCILMSGEGDDPSLKEMLLKAGAAGYLAKPVITSALLAEVRKLLPCN